MSDASPAAVPVPGIAGTTALVTGAAGGIGAAVVVALRAAGARVRGWDTTGDGDVEVVDVTDPESVRRGWAATDSDTNPIDLVVHAAGVMSADWDECMAVNAGGVRNVLDVVVPAMTTRRRGCVVVISSNAATTPRAAIPAYCASKAAATAYTRSVGLAAAGAGVRVNVVSPGSTDTPMLRGMWTDDQAGRDAVLAGSPEEFRIGIPLGRIATPDDIAATVTFLASDAARHVTLHDLRVDGGATLDQ